MSWQWLSLKPPSLRRRSSAEPPPQTPDAAGGDSLPEDSDPPTDRIAVPAGALAYADGGQPGAPRADTGHHQALLIARVVAAAVIVLALVAAILLPTGRPGEYRVVSEKQSVASTPPTKVTVPGLTLPRGSVPPAAAAPAAGIPLATGVPLATSPNAGASGPPVNGGTLKLSPSDGAAPGGGPTLPGGAGSSPLPQQKPCSRGWPAPRADQQGGLGSLIGLAPFAGPLSSEAFALGSVYQPILQLAGPILAEVEPVVTSNLYWINPLIDRVQAVESVVLAAILPYYGPYRQQLLDAEVELGRVLTPILQRFYASDAASCLVAWEAQIVDRAKGRPIQVFSLARPGAIITLGPRR
ncbi:hypothetical protein QSJ19_19085 [Gordonia sp. ABSL11-1]|uniref:hypothetical protein n=1 Tax=Gordonia sp. ABSL11-1 TaxID=3053924 RepID=UPI00257486D1|nr:hypothetical protein [Gordonia sp. ABSL11-1]MDL9947647.1 hypothetical protein [Gordonia sp. ABSL11-1]